jgi:predicted transglutaminase-like cysteine proteinase
MSSPAGSKTTSLYKAATNGVALLLLSLVIFLSLAENLAQEYFTNMNKIYFARIAERFGNSGATHLAQTRQLLLSRIKQTSINDASLLSFVNDLINKVPQVEDSVHWGVEDYWATPAELIASNGGDCEDFVIGKYFSLREGGIPAKNLRLTYVKAVHEDKIENHMVLAYYPTPEAEPLLLDNLLPQMLPASKRPDLLPVYEFNGEQSDKFSGAAIRKWDAMVEHMKKEFE